MYVSSNPSQVVATNQGYQSGATAFPVSLRPSFQGNTVTYAFNPVLSQAAAWGLNPAIAASTVANPMLNQSLAMAWNPMLASTAWNPTVNPIQAMSNAMATGQMSLNTIQSSTGLAQMRVDLHETNSDMVIAAELPNVSLNDLNLTVTDDSLSISATAFAGNRATSLFRTVALPTSIKSEQVEATYANGILEIRAPKSDMVTRRKVKVNLA